MHDKPFRAAKELVQPFSLSFPARLCFPYLRDVAKPGMVADIHQTREKSHIT